MHNRFAMLPHLSASEVTTLWRYTNLFIIIIIITRQDVHCGTYRRFNEGAKELVTRWRIVVLIVRTCWLIVQCNPAAVVEYQRILQTTLQPSLLRITPQGTAGSCSRRYRTLDVVDCVFLAEFRPDFCVRKLRLVSRSFELVLSQRPDIPPPSQIISSVVLFRQVIIQRFALLRVHHC